MVNTSDIFFELNTKITTTMLVVCSILLSTKELFGTSIDCYSESASTKEIMNNYCWTMGTFIPAESIDEIHGTQIDNYGENSQRYYQWMLMVLIGQALVCYLPACLWKSFEGGFIENLCKGLEFTNARDDWNKQKNKIITYFNSKNAGARNTKYAYHYAICKALSLIAIVFNIVILDMVIPKFWFNYAEAINALFLGQTNDWYKKISLVFPKQAKCLFFKYGPSGHIVQKDLQCLLPLNNINEKIFAVIWVWYIVLLSLSVVNGIYVALSFTNKNLRTTLLRTCNMLHVSNKQMSSATMNGHLGDCFVLNQMAKNLDPIIFTEIIEDLSLEYVSQPH